MKNDSERKRYHMISKIIEIFGKQSCQDQTESDGNSFSENMISIELITSLIYHFSKNLKNVGTS